MQKELPGFLVGCRSSSFSLIPLCLESQEFTPVFPLKTFSFRVFCGWEVVREEVPSPTPALLHSIFQSPRSGPKHRFSLPVLLVCALILCCVSTCLGTASTVPNGKMMLSFVHCCPVLSLTCCVVQTCSVRQELCRV